MFAERLRARLAAQKEAGLFRNPPVFDHADDTDLIYKSRPVLDFGSNDYLGLSRDSRVKSIVADSILRYGSSSCSSRLASGSRRIILDAEQSFADHFGYESALFFASGYQANGALINTILAPNDEVFFDKRIHASMVDALRSSPASIHGYRHSDLDHLRKRISESGPSLPIILTESLFSMDGDCLDCSQLAEIKSSHNAVTIVDEAHAFGALGDQGRGLASGAATIAVGTLGKAFAFHGAFVLGPRVVREALINFASAFIFTTGTSVAHAYACRQILELVANAEDRRTRLCTVSDLLKEKLISSGFPVQGQAHILAVQIGDETRAKAYSEKLLERGFYVLAARSPTVPQGKAILRISLSAGHSTTDLQNLNDTLSRIRDEY